MIHIYHISYNVGQRLQRYVRTSAQCQHSREFRGVLRFGVVAFLPRVQVEARLTQYFVDNVQCQEDFQPIPKILLLVYALPLLSPPFALPVVCVTYI